MSWPPRQLTSDSTEEIAVKFGKEFDLQVGGQTMRGIEAWGTEAEIERLVEVDAPEKGWAVHQRGEGSVVLRKPRAVEDRELSGKAGEEPVASGECADIRTADQANEWEEGMRASADLPDGVVVCARCRWIDRRVEMQGMYRCGSPAAKNSIQGRATWYGPFYRRKCHDFT